MLAEIIGATLGAAGGGINGALQGWQNLYNSKKLAGYNYDLQKRGLEEFPTSQRLGLEAAGYNPMLALGSVGSHTYSGGMPSGGAGMGDIVGGARQGAKLAHDIEDRLNAETDNIKADTELKNEQKNEAEARKGQTLATTDLTNSQTERTDLAYGRDIAATITDIAGTGASLYSAKAMADVAKQNADTKARKVQAKPPARNNAAKPAVQGSVNSKPSAGGAVGASAKNAGKIAARLAKEIILPLAIAAPIANEARKSSEKIQTRKDKNERYWQPRRVLLH